MTHNNFNDTISKKEDIMFVDNTKREWSCEENYLRFKNNQRKYYKYSLAFEDFADAFNRQDIYQKDCFLLLKEFRKNYANLTEQEILEQSTIIANLFEDLLIELGEKNFTRHDENYITFNWEE